MDNHNFATYEYMSKSVKSNEQFSCIDCYEAFGWEATSTDQAPINQVTIALKGTARSPTRPS